MLALEKLLVLLFPGPWHLSGAVCQRERELGISLAMSLVHWFGGNDDKEILT